MEKKEKIVFEQDIYLKNHLEFLNLFLDYNNLKALKESITSIFLYNFHEIGEDIIKEIVIKLELFSNLHNLSIAYVNDRDNNVKIKNIGIFIYNSCNYKILFNSDEI